MILSSEFYNTHYTLLRAELQHSRHSTGAITKSC